MSLRCESLAQAVIIQALSDANIGVRIRNTPALCEQAEAVSFLTDTGSAWSRARHFWCDLAGLDESQVRHHAMRALEGKPPISMPSPPKRRPRPGSKLARALEMLERPDGVSLAEMAQEFGWTLSSANTALTSDLPIRFGIRSVRCPDDRYRLRTT
ncbi:DUF3489 domain-containing protein [Sandarakinorhabdus sp.]|uniref:DUF3489 domain-containing protein n=1 Tax=Sandarakinorhabdus sp. TaxID=1916663 RepID=UPI003F7252DB